MRVSGEDKFKVFKLLLDEVVAKSGIKKSFEEFTNQHLKKLSIIIGRSLNTATDPVSPSTLRDYRYMYLRKPNYPFKADRNKLSELCRYLDHGLWEDFATQHELKAHEDYPDSFYRSEDIYSVINLYEGELQRIWDQNVQILKQDMNNPEPLFNKGICLLHQGNYKEAKKFLNTTMLYDPGNADVYHFLSLSCLEGKRPYRHRKEDIDQLMIYLDKALMIDPKRPDTICLKRLVQKDFYARIGYRYDNHPFSLRLIDIKALKFIARCAGLTTNETKYALL